MGMSDNTKVSRVDPFYYTLYNKAYLFSRSRVVVITGQSLVEAVDRGRVSLQHFSLLVLDECHHTRGGHPLRGLMNQYMQLKFGDRCSDLPQVSLISPIYQKLPQYM